MLWFIGLGVSGPESIPKEVGKVIQEADLVYLESFTSPIYKEHEENIRNLVNGDFKIAKRWLVEDGQEIINAAKNSTVVLLSYGDPYIATTHIELRIRAKLENIETKTVHSTSVVTAMIGEVGLQYYKVGRIMTIMRERKSITTPYRIISKNLIDGLHSVILLEYNQDKKFISKYSELTPMKRMMKRTELNGLMDYLCSENSSYVTGSVLVCDGGYTSW